MTQKAFAVDDLRASLTTVSPQAFDVTLPAKLTDGTVKNTAASGAGNLETKASRDVYRFSIPGGQSLNVDTTTCPGSYYLSWEVLNAGTGARVGSGGCTDGTFTNLPAGDYQLVVTPMQEKTGPYSLEVRVP